MKDDLPDLARRLGEIEPIIESVEETMRHHLSIFQKDYASVVALYSIVSELAQHKGISAAEFDNNFRKRWDICYDRELRKQEDQSPELAALMDERDLSSIPTDEPFPPLFPNQP